MYNIGDSSNDLSHPKSPGGHLPKDHPPPHVHVIGPGAEVKLEIETLLVSFAKGFSDQDLAYIQEYLMGRISQLMEKWHELQES